MVQGSLFLLLVTLYSINQSLVHKVVYNIFSSLRQAAAGASRNRTIQPDFLDRVFATYTQMRVVARAGRCVRIGADKAAKAPGSLSGAEIAEQVNQCERCEILG
jgi:hypothetical protein